MNFPKILSVLLITSHFMVSAGNHGVYYNELKAYKKAPATKEMFDEDAHSGLAKLQRDMIAFKNLNIFQRLVRSSLLSLDVVVVTPETMPKFYEYVDSFCRKARMSTPTVFIMRNDGFFSAASQKILMSSGGIVIGQKLLHDLSDDAIEAVVAREIGHIKHNHGNKGAIYIPSACLFGALLPLPGMALLLPLLIINNFEKEADEFACQNDKSKGIIEFCEFLVKKEKLREEEFVTIYNLLQDNSVDLSYFKYYTDLMPRYYLMKIGHNIGKACKDAYSTFFGVNPMARIAVAKKYLQQEVDRINELVKKARMASEKSRMELVERSDEIMSLVREEFNRQEIERLEVEKRAEQVRLAEEVELVEQEA